MASEPEQPTYLDSRWHRETKRTPVIDSLHRQAQYLGQFFGGKQRFHEALHWNRKESGPRYSVIFANSVLKPAKYLLNDNGHMAAAIAGPGSALPIQA